ncbi:hypothetical protein [Microbacterium caowuchunii]|uniref:Uncharacterized protein n=1 Tax=Microbacterium caowuchunii TaxID=2614638 RepID=A0A5N0TIZ8_9MICO|nr:hypothetical protein [Microbacterium caowuchunii]KAA9133856.1 hypothetical protein F6B40_08915 [Microbacterium caowuchunii]
MTDYETAALAAQWVGSVSSALAVVVAAVFGYLTLQNNRRSRDAQQRASLAAASGGTQHRQGLVAGARTGGSTLRVAHRSGETWALVNSGPDTVHLVRIEGLTDLDKRRLREVPPEPTPLDAGQSTEFVLTSRYTMSGPANVVVWFSDRPGGTVLRTVLQVPAP